MMRKKSLQKSLHEVLGKKVVGKLFQSKNFYTETCLNNIKSGAKYINIGIDVLDFQRFIHIYI